MTRLPAPPLEVGDLAISRDLLRCAPLLTEKVWALTHELERRGHDPFVFEAFRSDARAGYLYGFGRLYDDGRGIVTKAASGAKTFHRYGLAVDIISKAAGWKAPAAFWTDLRECATELGLRSGDDWDRDGIPVEDDPDEHTVDRPHVQWYTPGMPVTPTDEDWALLHASGIEAVWQKYNALARAP